jgi:hypothetical protein
MVAGTKSKTPKEVVELKITLSGTKPPIWRRFAVDSAVTLATLHDVIQIVMGWGNCHLHQFIINGEYFGPTDLDLDLEDLSDERKVKLRDIADRPKAKFQYEYDFGDGWRHGLEIRKVGPPEDGVTYPLCLAGALACPPEDCGGVWGYAEFLAAIQDPKHENHKEMLDWIGGAFEPNAFDLDAVNRHLRASA